MPEGRSFHILSNNFVIHFNRVADMRTRMFELEKTLSAGYAKPFQLNSVDDNAPPEIPRIAAQSPDRLNHLQVSQVNLGMLFNHPQPDLDWNKAYTQLTEYAKGAFTALNGIGIDSFLYSGLTTQVMFAMPGSAEVIEQIRSNLLKVEGDIFDVGLKLTLVEDNKFFINYHFANKTDYEPGTHVPRMIPAYLKAVRHGLLFTLDVNDRYGFNHEREYVSEPEDGFAVLRKNHQIITEKMEDIVLRGKLGWGTQTVVLKDNWSLRKNRTKYRFSYILYYGSNITSDRTAKELFNLAQV